MSVPALFLANWKMNMRVGETRSFAARFLTGYRPSSTGVPDTGIAPAFTCLAALADALPKDGSILLGAQNVHWLECGAHTGEVSTAMLQDFGVSFAIVGHSERRQHYGESDLDVARRARAAIDAGMKAVVCIGETREDYE
ncbi:MAG: triosephosphate isomerase, partial [Bdellovibrionales bacterium]|nr:triosephosphate isomerase [Bdellovibrionales bacterium]